ncbi:MAG TPA: HdeA/HdeB family chaperone [Myxococcaceae bacterium]|nr:HdeA/HdeB family chaperone [Myxococcaceae bacterium]
MEQGTLRWVLLSGLLCFSTPRAADAPRPIDVKSLSCQQWLEQPDDIRPMLVAWVHGYTRAGGESWILDAASAREFVATVHARCKDMPQGSFRYQILEVSKQRQAEAKKEAAAKKK